MNDICEWINKRLVLGNFEELDNESKCDLFDYVLKGYLTDNAHFFERGNTSQYELFKNANATDIVTRIEQALPYWQRNVILGNLIYYIISLISYRQNQTVLWYKNGGPACTERPVLSYDHDGNCLSVMTNENTSYASIFDSVYEVLQNKILYPTPTRN